MAAASKSSTFPDHIAIIMDGNGRWAKARHRPRVFGHQEGVKTVRKIVEYASEIGVKCLTLYSFSTENWNRPKSEISALFDLLRRYVQDDLKTLDNRDVRIRIIGSRDGLSDDMLALLDKVETTTKDNSSFFLNIAFNYGGRDELTRSTKAIATAVKSGTLDPADIDEDLIETYLDTSGLPTPDLVIRTSGEHRVSNFLLWQAAYAEFFFTDVLWPDFAETDLDEAIKSFQNRERRFGNLNTAEVA